MDIADFKAVVPVLIKAIGMGKPGGPVVVGFFEVDFVVAILGHEGILGQHILPLQKPGVDRVTHLFETAV